MNNTKIEWCNSTWNPIIKLITELKTKPFIPRCPGAGISFCNAHDRQLINELLEYFYGEKGEGNHV